MFSNEAPELPRGRVRMDTQPTFRWASMPIETLMRMRTEIDAHLPSTKLRDIDLESELVMQLKLTQSFQAKVLDDVTGEVPVNQIAQAINSTAAVLEKLVKLQIDLSASENLKRMESALIKAVNTLPDSAKEEFFNNYQQIAHKEGVQQ